MDIQWVNGSTDGIQLYVKKMGGDGTTIGDTSKVIFSENGEKITGILSFKSAVLNKKDYFQITAFWCDSLEITSSLVNELLTYYKTSKARFILSDTYTEKSIYTQALEKVRAIPYEYSFILSKKALLDRISATTAEMVRLTKNNKRSFARGLIDLLLDFDSELNSNINSSIGESLLPTNMRNERKHRIRLSYFVDTLVQDRNWYTYLLIQDETIIGFVKGKLEKNIMHVDLFTNKSYRKESETMLTTFLKNIPDVSIIMTSSKSHPMMNYLKRWFGKAIGSSYYLT